MEPDNEQIQGPPAPQPATVRPQPTFAPRYDFSNQPTSMEYAIDQASQIPGLAQAMEFGQDRLEGAAVSMARAAYRYEDMSPGMTGMQDQLPDQPFRFEAWAAGTPISAGERNFALPGGFSAHVQWSVGVDHPFDPDPQLAFKLTIPLQRGGGRSDY